MKTIQVYRLALKKERTLRLAENTVTDASHVAAIAHAELHDCPHERLLAFFVNGSHTIIGMMTIATTSGVSSSMVTAKGIAQAALTANATAVVLAHNHPSGDPTPSIEDERMTSRIQDLLAAVDTPLLDHVIVTSDPLRYTSFLEQGKL